jgi:RNA polymerase sigma factor (TIGR02999 family)
MAPNLLPPEELDALLAASRDGDTAARDRLVALLYDDLRRAAARLMRRARPDHTLQPSALVHEALLKLLAGDTLRTAADRQHLYRAAVQAMRQVLTDHHRHRASRRGPGRWGRHPLDVVLDHLTSGQGVAVEALGEALDRLAAVDARACLVTTFRFFLGLSLAEAAEALEIAEATAERDWRFARAWLRDELRPGESRP